ncbi:MAG: Uma2 family endonuclease [Chloroherpetonaceae bacterium]|nr:Uma2 family endonuclease [Chloroherpetonaceae bacterium]MDW8438723.1 Uma2 family endonuclease [Chloroherpetonaceae bacterium]
MAEEKATVDWREKYADMFEEPDISHIEIEDGEPVDNIFAEKQHRLLVSSLYTNWKPKEKFVATTNVGVFYSVSEPPIVPDALISFGVDFPTWEQLMSHKKYRAYFVWVLGKPPDVVVEVVTNRKGDELTEKMERYAKIRVPYYVVYDWMRLYGEPRLRVFALNGASYRLKDDLSLDKFGLKVGLWEGSFEGVSGEWLRWHDEDGNLLLSNEEYAEQERLRAEAEKQRAEQERLRAEAEKQRAEKLAAKLRAMGINPDE